MRRVDEPAAALRFGKLSELNDNFINYGISGAVDDRVDPIKSLKTLSLPQHHDIIYQPPGPTTTPIREALFFRSGVKTRPMVGCIITPSALVSTQFALAQSSTGDQSTHVCGDVLFMVGTMA